MLPTLVNQFCSGWITPVNKIDLECSSWHVLLHWCLMPKAVITSAENSNLLRSSTAAGYCQCDKSNVAPPGFGLLDDATCASANPLLLLQGASWLLGVPGASSTVLEVLVPYSRGSLTDVLGQVGSRGYRAQCPEHVSDIESRSLRCKTCQQRRRRSISIFPVLAVK
jgi:hypothetical protein